MSVIEARWKNAVEFFVAELLPPIERREIGGDKIAAVTAQIFEIAGAKIIDHRQARLRKFFLQRESEIRADEAGPAGDEKVEVFRVHGAQFSDRLTNKS